MGPGLKLISVAQAEPFLTSNFILLIKITESCLGSQRSLQSWGTISKPFPAENSYSASV